MENYPGWKMISLREQKEIQKQVTGPFIRVIGPIVVVISVLAGMLVFRGVNNLILQGETIGLPDAYKVIAARPVPDFIGEISALQGIEVYGKPMLLNGTAVLAGAICIVAFVALTLLNRINKSRKKYEVESIGALLFKLASVTCAR